MKCTICKHPADLIFKNMNGYVEGEAFDIYECENCNSQFISPMSNLQDSYDKIYGKENSDSIYSFYYYLADGVKSLSKPLKTLSQFSAIFWAVYNAMSKLNIENDAKVLEIGSGLGYLVHAFRKTGYKATGLEYSPQATKYAKEKFGNYFTCGDVFEYAKDHQNEFDCIIATEVLEHVEDPTSFCAAAVSMLKPGGSFILTTPNKDFEPTKTIWKTDYPPIHLWWYTEKSLEEIAKIIKAACTIFSFETYKKTNLWHWNFANGNYQANKPHILDKNGERLVKQTSLKQKLQKFIPAWLYIYSVTYYHKMTFLQKVSDKTNRMYIICAAFTKH